MEQPLVSIVTTFYNSVKLGDFVHRAMACLLNQTYSNIEFICVNDGSQDETLNQLKEYALKDSRIIIVNKENEGVAQYAKAAGQNVAKGEWVMLFDHDDLFDHDGIEKAMKVALKDPSLDAVSMRVKVLFSDGRVKSYENLDVSTKNQFSMEFRKLTGMEAYQKTVGKYHVHFRGIIKRNVFNQYSYRYTEKLVNGDEIVERLIFKEIGFMGVCNAVYEHFIYQNSSAKSYSLKKIDIVRTDVILREIFQKDGVYEKRKEIFEVDAYQTFLKGVKVFQHLKSSVDNLEANRYQQILLEGYQNLDRNIILNHYKGWQKLYHSLLLQSFKGMMQYFRFKK